MSILRIDEWKVRALNATDMMKLIVKLYVVLKVSNLLLDV
jgi:hypothetical protein